MPTRTYSKTFTPLESDPEIFTSLSQNLGLSPNLHFQEILSLSSITSKALAYILIFPTTAAYDDERAAEECGVDGRDGGSGGGDVVFLKQTVHNACGLYALLHAVCNGEGRGWIRENTFLHSLITIPAPDRTKLIDTSNELEDLYTTAANQGSTKPPDVGVEVDHHYTCFVPSVKDCKLYELDGDRKGPVARAELKEDPGDFDEKALRLMREIVEKEEGERKMYFSVMALVEES